MKANAGQQTGVDEVYNDAYTSANNDPMLYKHRFGDGSLAADASVNIGSPRVGMNSLDVESRE